MLLQSDAGKWNLDTRNTPAFKLCHIEYKANQTNSLTMIMDSRRNWKILRVRNVKFATYLKFATCENTNKINELW